MEIANASSIYADLKKFAGPIRAIKITNEPDDSSSDETTKPTKKLTVDTVDVMLNKTTKSTKSTRLAKIEKKEKTEKTEKIEKTTENTMVKKAVAAPKKPAENAPDVSIDNIAAMVRAPITPIRDQNGVVHDTTTLAAKCERGHIHKYFLKDIIANNGLTKCTTCSSGNKFTIMVRELVETTLDSPFILAEKKLDTEANAVEYTNPILKLTILCMRTPGTDTIDTLGDQSLIKLHPTTSLRKVKDVLHTMLANYPILTEEQQARVLALKPTKTVGKKKIYLKDPLPFTPELATLNASSAQNPLLAQMQLNIVAPNVQTLCLENC